MAPKAIVVTLKRAFKASILCLLCLGAAKSSQLMLKLPARSAVLPTTNDHIGCFDWPAVDGADSYILGWTWNPSEFATVSGPVNSTNVIGTTGCFHYPGTKSPPFVAVSAVARAIQSGWSPIITRTNYVTVTGLQSASPAGPWADLPGMTLTTEATNASEFWKLRIYQFSNWPFPPGMP